MGWNQMEKGGTQNSEEMYILIYENSDRLQILQLDSSYGPVATVDGNW